MVMLQRPNGPEIENAPCVSNLRMHVPSTSGLKPVKQVQVPSSPQKELAGPHWLEQLHVSPRSRFAKRKGAFLFSKIKASNASMKQRELLLNQPTDKSSWKIYC